jgi:hypothetical protein
MNRQCKMLIIRIKSYYSNYSLFFLLAIIRTAAKFVPIVVAQFISRKFTNAKLKLIDRLFFYLFRKLIVFLHIYILFVSI